MTTPNSSSDASWHSHLKDSPEELRAILDSVHTIAVLGIKTADDPKAPAYATPLYIQKAGYKIIPVPVYYPDVTEILGYAVYRTVSAIPGPVDVVEIFRKPSDVPKHVDDIIAKHPKVVWMQLGIRNDEAAEAFARAGIDVVQDRCIARELHALGR